MGEPKFVCAQCGKPGSVDPGFTLMDSRYATGRCSGDHVGKQHLVREDIYVSTTAKPKKKRRA